jgi:hypothetical protein
LPTCASAGNRSTSPPASTIPSTCLRLRMGSP